MKLKALLGFLFTLLLTSCTLRLGWPSRMSNAPAPTDIPLIKTAEPVAAPNLVSPEHPIALPPGFAISVFAQRLDNPRMMALSPVGQLYVAERSTGRVVRLPDLDGDGLADQIQVVAETPRILRFSDPDQQGVFHRKEIVIDGLPAGHHSTRTVLFSPDYSQLFVSIGSSCNVCIEQDERRATIMRYNPDGSAGQVYARGLRNAVGIAFRPGTQELWATNNGRDLLGADLPPETIYSVQEGGDYGWPRCHAAHIIDPEFGEAGACDGVLAPLVEMQAHSAPLGLEFYTGNQFPADYQGDLFVAFHGSWNRSVPVGYKVVRIPMENGKPGPVQDFAVGWLSEGGSSWGRPVDVITGSDGSL